MATITNAERTNITKLVVGMFNAAPGAAYLAEFTAAYQGMGNSLANLATALGNTGAFKALYPSYLTATEFATKFLTTLGLQGNQEANDWVVAKVNGGTSYASVILQAVTAISNTNDAAFADAKALLNNKTTVAEYYSVTKGASSEDLGVLQGTLGAVKADTDLSTPAAIEKALGEGSGTGNQIELTLGRDVINAAQEGQTFFASLAQNQLGGVANTFESGDVINAKGTGNKLIVDVAASGLIGGATSAPAISATTKNIQVVEFRAQDAGQSGGKHTTEIDAQKMEGVKEWWSVNSRHDLRIEDVRTRPEDTTIGMRDTDPEANFSVYFDPQQLSNNATVKNSALTLTLDSVLTPGNLTEVPVDGVGFYLGGTLYQLKSDTIGAAVNHTELLAALKAAAAAIPALKDVTFTLNANNTITLVDPAGQEFKVGGWQFVNNQVPPAGNIKFDQAVGEPVRGLELITTTVELDNVGRTSAGGALDIGSLGDGGVEKFEVNVDRASWVSKLLSTDHAGTGGKQFLQEVDLNSKGANGKLTVGTLVADKLDGRVESGLTDVRVVNGADFKANLNLGITLTGDAIGRYLDKATAAVEFNYTTGQGNDIVNLSVDSAVSEDPDFALNVNLGAGDDRLILADATRLNSTSVDGGTGTNTFVTSTSVGTTAKTTFKSFANFQNYEVEGTGSDHNFTNLTSVRTVVVATDAGASTLLRNLPAEIAAISLSGKNQTIGNLNNADQTFSNINVEAAKSEALTVTLDNTARVSGELIVDNLNVRDDATTTTNLSAVRTLNVVSNGVRQTANEVTDINAERVGTFNFSGAQALTVGISEASNTAGVAANVIDLKVDGSALTGDLHLTLDSTAVVNVVDTNKTVSVKGGAGTKDVLEFTSGISTTAKTSVSGFETVSFHGGQFNAVNTTDVQLYKTDGAALKLTNLRGVENVELGSVASNVGSNVGGAQIFQTNAASNASTLNLTAKSSVVGTQDISTHGFTTLNLKLDSTLALGVTYKQYNLNLEDVAVDTNGNPVVVTSGTYATAAAVPTDDFTKANLTNVVVTGGSSTATTVADTLNLNNLSATVKLVDVSGYKGVVTATLGDALETTINSVVHTTGNTVVKLGAFGANFTDASHDVTGGDLATVTTFQFTADALKNAAGDANFQWQINGFKAIDATDGSLSNLTVLDLSALGIQGLADMQLSQVGTATVIKSNTTHNFEIVLTGVNVADVDLANFKFAV